MSYGEAFLHSDPAYWVLQVFSHNMDWGIYGVNVIGSIIFMIGLISFLRRLENPWLGLTIAVSYTIVIVAIGYVRQGIALGLIFWALTALSDRKFIKFAILVVFAALFHKSAVVMLGVGIFTGGHGKLIKALASVIVAIGVWQSFISGSEDHYVRIYIESEMQSSGAYIRVFMNLIPSFIFLIFREKWRKLYLDYEFWYIIALGSIGSLFIVGLATTAVDRIALYLIPIQIIVFSRLPYLIENKISVEITTFFVVLYYGLVYFVWFNYAANAYAWLPYQNILAEGIPK
jgi:hypothetical protein